MALQNPLRTLCVRCAKVPSTEGAISQCDRPAEKAPATEALIYSAGNTFL
jgi:hypothetical protein